MEKSQNIQDSFLNNARKEKSLVTIFLVAGVRLNGRIKSFDKYSLILESNGQEHLVFKHAISTVVTGRPNAAAAVHAHAASARSGDSSGVDSGRTRELERQAES